MMKSRPTLLGRVAILYSVMALSMSEVHRVSAFVSPVSPCSRGVALFAASDEYEDANKPISKQKNHYFMNQITDEAEKNDIPVDMEPAILEEDLLSQHSEMESILKHNYVPISPDDAMKHSNDALPEPEASVTENTRLALAIDKSIFHFNENLVNTLSAAISFFYPTFSKRTTFFSPLIGTEYNEDDTENETILRFEKFYILETVARIPYFAYLSVLHVRESLGSRGFLNLDLPNEEANEKRIDAMRTHYAQADNELHHLLIMEALGGNSNGFDRFLAHTLAFSYYWFVMLVYVWNDKAAYHLNEVIEDHAYKTYDEFLVEHEQQLKTLPVPEIARKYYESDFRKNPNLFKAFCAVCKSETSDARSNNRPHELNNLYDVFMNIRDDEKEHWMSLCNIVQYGEMDAVDEANVKSTASN